ncbi:YheC/YheD family endospore coat-associated protein [Priestia flexa]|uniref:YheC/YheD family protein n=1 Tax=Priestia flexa TaxID=86664 RepID=A0ABU4J2T9_9BACI|nr:YheC/YheD family protein [Priestia flexa]MDW8515315.1 YheC/YheD family protein [Priestia flexa]
MTNLLFQLKVLPEQEDVLYVPSSLYHHQLNTIYFGTFSSICQVYEDPEAVNEIKISQNLLDLLHLPIHNDVHIYTDEHSIYIGPLIGILSAGFTGSLLRPIGKRSLLFAKLLSTASITGGIPFLFGIHHIQWDSGTILGYFYTSNGWEQREVPLPNVIYNRLPNRKTESLDAFQTIKEKLADEYQIPLFNPNFFNKWTVHTLLEKDATVRNFLPYTIDAPSLEQLSEMLEQYESVYLKPKNGSLGRGIYTLSYCSTQHVYQICFKEEKLIKKTHASLAVLVDEIFKTNERDHYIAQQAIPLFKKDNRIVDFRVHTNKNLHNEWELSAIAAKISGGETVTTHMTNGGEIESLQRVFTNPETRKKTEKLLESTALLISLALDHQVEGLIGEIGFDFGVDTRGNVWMFEANSKPGRSIFLHPSLRKEDQYTRKLSLEYAIFLSKQAILSLEASYP